MPEEEVKSMKSHPEEAIQLWDRAEREPSHTSS